jgi:hypothetical protein
MHEATFNQKPAIRLMFRSSCRNQIFTLALFSLIGLAMKYICNMGSDVGENEDCGIPK